MSQALTRGAAGERSPGARIARIALIAVSSCFAVVFLRKLAERGASVDLRDAAYYYGVPVVLSAAALYAAFLRGPVRALISTCALAAGVGLLAAELYVAFTAKSPREAQRERLVSHWIKSGAAYDPRSVLEVVRDLRAEKVDAYPSFYPMSVLPVARGTSAKPALAAAGGGDILPLGTVSNTVTVVCNETGEHLIYRSDRHGFHNPASAWDRRPVHFAAVGDSFTEGYCVPSDRNFVALVRDRHPATLNLGVQGNGPLLELAGLTEYLSHVRPRTVLWFYYEGNDLVDLEIERRNPLLAGYLFDGFTQNLIARQSTADQAVREHMAEAMARRAAEGSGRPAVEDLLFLRHLRDRLKLALTGTLAPSFDEEANLALLRRVLATANNRVEAWDGTLVFVYLPSVWTHMQQTRQPRQSRLRERVLATARAVGMPVIDVSADFLAHPDPASLFVLPDREAHYNERGYRLVADRVLDRLPAILPALEPRGGPAPPPDAKAGSHAG
jgi:lysophospholipase L1-like esterase